MTRWLFHRAAARSPIRRHRSTALLVAVVALLCCITRPAPSYGQWAQWGGPDRNFIAKADGLADKWPKDGPRTIWRRPLGHGYSAISIDDGKLFTMYRADDREIVIAMDAAKGDTLWEHRYDGKPPFGLDPRFGAGPRGTPLIHGGRVFTVGVGAVMHCLDESSGRVHWSHNLADEFGAAPQMWGYACSPIAYKNLVIVTAGGSGHGVMAFDAETGAVAWSVQNFDNGYSSPTLVTVDGKEQLIVIVSDRVAGLDPADGRLLWEHSHPTMFNVNASTPIWCGDNVLFAASAYGSGARGLKLSRDGDATSVKELWRQRKMEIHFGTPLLIGDHVYASIGDNGPTFFAAVNVKTGEMAWRKRGLLAKASGIVVGNRLILIDEDGKLLLAKPSPDDIEIISEAQVFESRSWTLPTLVGTTLYLRNLESIVALDIG